MKQLTKLTDAISRVAEWISMAMILGMVGLIVAELIRRNIDFLKAEIAKFR